MNSYLNVAPRGRAQSGAFQNQAAEEPAQTDPDSHRQRDPTTRGISCEGTHSGPHLVLAMLLLDCGLRIGEALNLERDNVDLDNLVLRVLGKGSKERLVPISLEMRKHLFRSLRQTSGRYVFAVFSGVPCNGTTSTWTYSACAEPPVSPFFIPTAPPRLRRSRHEERARRVPAITHPRTFEHQHHTDLPACDWLRTSSGRCRVVTVATSGKVRRERLGARRGCVRVVVRIWRTRCAL